MAFTEDWRALVEHSWSDSADKFEPLVPPVDYASHSQSVTVLLSTRTNNRWMRSSVLPLTPEKTNLVTGLTKTALLSNALVLTTN
jgi:hypothetical protein